MAYVLIIFNQVDIINSNKSLEMIWLVSGFINKVMVGMSKVLPDKVIAARVHKQQEPVSKKRGLSIIKIS
jgi:hypothetical protein